ncbi:helix-turn-helix domain-containing protein [Actinomadura geliboluensis]|uniref:helix-turn-helix domain-containing protein n=1 Tax=Actinomadura geliboluensis TaxID=882440 RepID=UPI0036BB16B9
MTHWIVSAVECRSTASVRIASVGYAKLTMESVAARAGTGIAVLYRRWPNKDRSCSPHLSTTGTAIRSTSPTPAGCATTSSQR